MKLHLSRLPVLFLFAGLSISPLSAQPPFIGAESDGGEILTRGPVHEAFAGVVNYNPEAGLIVELQPPEPIEEMPPEERPVDADTAWIPGYWAWDDERNDFIWISGTWRVLPPGRAWISGYWGDTGRGYQWVSGYWEDARRQEVVYLEPPPLTLEQGPSSPPPSPDFNWAPGYWEWRDGRYLWRPGYWIEGRTDWVWVPSYYVWTPRGHVFVEGYWDYTPVDRGLLFAPVYYREHRRSRSYYRPSIVINVAILADHLFLRPRYSHYYFGDYYDSHYESSGFFAAFSYQSSRRGYDPFYSHSRWRHRDDRDWERRYQSSYDYRRQHVDARPPRVWSGTTITVNVNQNITQIGGEGSRQTVTYAQPIQQYARMSDAPIQVERTASTNFQQEVQLTRQVQEQRVQRRMIESQQNSTSWSPQSGPVPQYPSSQRQIGAAGQEQSVSSQASASVALPTSPIVARQRSDGRQPPPRAQASRREQEQQFRQTERTTSPEAAGPQPNQVPSSRRDAPEPRVERGAGPEPVIGATPRYEPVRQRDRGGLRADNSAGVEARRLEEQARQEELRQAEDTARRNVQQRQDQSGAQPRQELPDQPQQRVTEQPRQGREWADERRRAIEAEQRAAQPQPQDRGPQQRQPQAERARDEQQRREQERQDKQRGQQQQLQQQADARQQQAEAQFQAREQQGRAAEQAREQRAQAEQARAQRVQAEQAREQQLRAAEQARERQARAAEQAEAARQNASPNRGQNQRPPQKKSKEQLEEEERLKKGKGGTE